MYYLHQINIVNKLTFVRPNAREELDDRLMYLNSKFPLFIGQNIFTGRYVNPPLQTWFVSLTKMAINESRKPSFYDSW